MGAAAARALLARAPYLAAVCLVAALLDPDVDFDLLARELKLSGGNLQNIALVAACYAAAEHGTIHLAHLARAAWREHQRLGRAWDGTHT